MGYLNFLVSGRTCISVVISTFSVCLLSYGRSAPATHFALKRVKTRYLTLFLATNNCVVICRILEHFSPKVKRGSHFHRPSQDSRTLFCLRFSSKFGDLGILPHISNVQKSVSKVRDREALGHLHSHHPTKGDTKCSSSQSSSSKVSMQPDGGS